MRSTNAKGKRAGTGKDYAKSRMKSSAGGVKTMTLPTLPLIEATSTPASPPPTASSRCILERGYSIEEAVTLVYELALPVHTVISENRTAVTAYIEQLKAAEFAEHWGRLWPTNQQDIESAIQVLPAAERDQARYDMAFRTPPMPEQYWPTEA